MKKILFLIVGLALALVIAGCSDDSTENGENNGDPVVYTAPGDVIDRVEAGETFAFIIGDETCSACNHYLATTLTEVEEDHDLVLPFIELNGIEQREEDRVDVVTLIDDHLEGQFSATPTTYFMIDGVLADVTVGAITYDEFADLYEMHIGPLDEDSNDELTEEADVEETEAEENPEKTPDVEDEETE